MSKLALVPLVAGTTVSAFESFGSILVLGMFVVPPATARLLTDRLAPMLWLSAALAVTACVIGYFLASPWVLGCNAAGMIVAGAGGQFGVALVFAPRHGLAAQALRRLRLARRIASEEILASLYRAEEAATPRDEAYWKNIYYLTTPTADCGGKGGTCKTQQDWVNAWTEIRG